jgi:hypothetical protein
MYKLLRNTHLLLGLFLCFFVLMFGLSSMQMSHQNWIENKWEEARLALPVDPQDAATPRALALQLMDRQNMRGGLGDVKESAEEMYFVIGHMGTMNQVRFKRGATEAQVTRRVAPFIGMMVAMHRMFGLDKPYTPHVFWGALMFFTSIGLLLLGATGIYLWFKIHKERVIGSILLFGGLAFGLTMISLLWVG